MIKEYRLEKAYEFLQEQIGTISEIAYQVGFSSPSYFNTCFREYYGYPPGKVKQLPPSGVRVKYSISRKSMFAVLAIGIMAALLFILYLMRSEKNSLTNESNPTQISIAVLPFKSLSDDPDKQFMADGAMHAILLHLSMIEDLRVMDRTSVEQYRETDKTANMICQELDVGFLLEGSFQKYGDQARLIVRLIGPKKEGNIWVEEYNRNWEDIFSVQSEVAQIIASKLHVVITPQEKEIIEKVPTTSLTAHEFHLKATAEHQKHWLKWNDMEAVERAEELYHLALEYDSTYAQAYIGLAMVYWHKHYGDVLSENYLDSMLILADKALSFDDQLASAYKTRGDYYLAIKDNKNAIKEYEKAIKLNPNRMAVYLNSAYLYEDEVKTIENLLKAASLHRGYYLPRLYRQIAVFLDAFNKEKSYSYLEEALKLDDDSADHYYALTLIEKESGNFEKAIEFGGKTNTIDSTEYWYIFFLGLNHSFIGQYEESLEYFKKCEQRLQSFDRFDLNSVSRLGHAYFVNGFNEEAGNYFNKGLEFYRKLIELDRYYKQDLTIYYGLAALHASLGDEDKAYENLRLMNQREWMPR